MTQYMCDCFGEFNNILLSGFMKEEKTLKLNGRNQHKIDVKAANGVYL